VNGVAGRFNAVSRAAVWRGRSGTSYALIPEKLETFSLVPATLYLIARGTMVLWVGTAEDIIADQQSRARFRLALAAADRAFRVETAPELATVWDLEGAEPEAGLSAA
jgi:hypothetical protein